MKTLKEFLTEAKRDPQSYPAPHDIGNNDRFKTHPIIHDLKAGHKIVKHEVVDHFEDDHLPCLATHTTMSNGRVHKTAHLYLSTEGMREHFHAEVSDEHKAKLGHSLVAEHDHFKAEHKKAVADYKAEQKAKKK